MESDGSLREAYLLQKLTLLTSEVRDEHAGKIPTPLMLVAPIEDLPSFCVGVLLGMRIHPEARQASTLLVEAATDEDVQASCELLLTALLADATDTTQNHGFFWPMNVPDAVLVSHVRASVEIRTGWKPSSDLALLIPPSHYPTQKLAETMVALGLEQFSRMGFLITGKRSIQMSKQLIEYLWYCVLGIDKQRNPHTHLLTDAGEQGTFAQGILTPLLS